MCYYPVVYTIGICYNKLMYFQSNTTVVVIMKKIFFLFLFTFLTILSFAQTDTSKGKKDSLKNRILQDQSNELQKLQIQRNADSILRMELQQQLDQLKSSDNQQKQNLAQQIEELNNKETERVKRQRQKIDSLRQFVSGFPVLPFGDTLFRIYNKIGSFTPADRASSISERIKKLAKNFDFSPDSLKAVISDQGQDIVYGENIIMSITEPDALWENSNTTELATKYGDIIRTSIVKYKKSISFLTILKQIGLALLVIGILVVIIFYIGKLFKWTAARIRSEEGRFFKGYNIRHYQIFDAKRQISFLLLLNTILKWLLIVLAISLTLPLLFSIFPWTKNFADTLLGYVLTPIKAVLSKVWDYLPNLFTIIVIVIIFRYIMKLLLFIKREIEQGDLKIEGFYPDWANPTYQIIRVLVYAFMFVVIFPYLPGSDSPIFKGVSVFLGILFTFGSAGPLSNLIAGFVITYMRSFKIGDRVKIGDVTGDVIAKSLLVTRIRTIKNEIISIPNSTVMSGQTINFSSEAPDKGLIIHSTVTIGYDAPWRQVHQLLINAAKKTDFILKDPEPFVLQTSLDDFFISYQVNAYTNEPNKQALIYSSLHQHIQDEFNEAGVEIMSPHYRAMRDGNDTTIPGKPS